MLVNINAVQHLEPGRYQKILYRYDLDSLYWSSKDLGTIYTELALIYQHQGLVNIPPVTARMDIISVSGCRWRTPMPQLREKQEPYLSLSHNLLR